MLSREDFYMIKQMRQQGAYIVDIATQVGYSERTCTGGQSETAATYSSGSQVIIYGKL